MATVFNPDTTNGSTIYQGPYKRKLYVASLPNLEAGKYFDISDYVTQVSVNYTMNEASEISFDIVDQGLDMSAKNYFVLGRDVIYETQTLGSVNSYTGEIRLVHQLFEIASVNVSQGSGGSVTYSIQCWTKAIQQMKRDKKPGNIKGNGTAFVKAAALKYGLQFYCEETTKKKTINKAGGSKQADSVWDVIKTLAGDAKFVLFEVDGVLVFASEKFLLKKWGTDFKYDITTTTDPKTKKKKQKKKPNRFIPLQFPNSGPEYVGTPGYFYLTEHPTIHKSANDPYAMDGSCSVERISGTQIRPGMTAYVGTVPNMSGYCLVESVSFNEMVPDPVAVSFRTLTRDEEKDTIKLLPIGKTYQQTFQPSMTDNPILTTKEAARTKTGKAISAPKTDARIIGVNQPTAEDGYRYPVMPRANITKTYGSLYERPSDAKEDSTNDLDSLIITGNINLWDRPIFPVRNTANTKTLGYHTLYSTSVTEVAGSEYRTIILPTIYTVDGVAVIKTPAEVIAKYNADGGYQGSAKHLGVLSGATKRASILNARDYAFLLSRQQELVVRKRIPGFSLQTLVNTPGGSDSLWT